MARRRGWARCANMFIGNTRIEPLNGIGHNVPQEAPEAFVEAVIDVDRL
jgi:pimeloyl-ACP methyl ester carboxylesterase